ncbi:TrkA family potassium uptake protein [Yimella sp. cx-51]|uniref:potassium channel family protein n=1 Tax=Yimella sp. cx-51 TaxID=2770551 RepID=UPI00165DA1E7|nr:TrkA family potassium uptake protein [Yimella sp. cx-51]MBC9957656.1 TrkA family potassium uptake protein [Yimella sp. cx-51]MBD2758697.1 TrkA family potassium uptake protein [Yimella sp. cx-573]QTH36989.1 TrkA family potassium uptake protein [Yimella sp. cx-51]
MRVVIVGAGSVGRSIGRELLISGHQVLFIDKYADESKSHLVPEATWLLADACETTTLHEAGLQDCDVVVCATGDDKVNLVVSLLAKTEFGVGRTVARISNPKNEWMFDEGWGVDVAVSTPRLMTALVEEAVSVGDLVRLFQFQQGRASMVEITVPADGPVVGLRVDELRLPEGTVLVGIIRDEVPIAPTPNDEIEGFDELLFLTTPESEPKLGSVLTGREASAIRTVTSELN